MPVNSGCTQTKVLEQDDHIIAYASRALTAPEWQYSVIQTNFGIRKNLYTLSSSSEHYLLGHSFQNPTDHAPPQWLSTQKMKGMLCLSLLAIQSTVF